MKISLRPGYEPESANAPDLRIIIDVFRASTTTLAILENGARTLMIANDFELLKKFSEDGYLIVSEVFDLGIDNSPTLVKALGVQDRNVALKTSNLTTALEKNSSVEAIIACFNNLGAVFAHTLAGGYQNVEIVPAGHMASQQMNFEDRHCAEILKESLESQSLRTPDGTALKGRVSELCRAKSRTPHYLDDLNLAVRPNISTGVPKIFKKMKGLFEVRLQGELNV
jgi:phosphosulfolactate phosphohydrolase-like enzyme